MNLNHVTVSVTAMAPALAFYRALGFKLIVINAHYARFELPAGEATFSIELAPEAPGAHAPQLFIECDVDSEHARLSALGIAFETAPADMPWLWRHAHLRDPSGNLICLYHAGANRKQPPWRLGAAAYEAQFNIVILDDGVVLAKRPGADWRALQEEFAGYKSSLGPYDFAGAAIFIAEEWPDLFTQRIAAMREFAGSAERTLRL